MGLFNELLNLKKMSYIKKIIDKITSIIFLCLFDNSKKAYIKKLSEQIHKSDTFGSFIETGASNPTSYKLLSVGGASGTVYMAECPYSKEYITDKYNLSDEHRFVSKDVVETILNHHITLHKNNPKHNTTYVSSFQVGDIDKDICTHGWIGISHKESKVYYHVTIREKMTRDQYIETIGSIGIELLWMNIFNTDLDNDNSIILNSNVNIDDILNMQNKYEIGQLINFTRKKNKTHDSIITLTPSKNSEIGNVTRFESFVRKYDKFNIIEFKDANLNNLDTSDKDITLIIISCNTDDIVECITSINKFNLHVVINKNENSQNIIDLIKQNKPHATILN
jgi:hypothetical protein